MSCDSFVRLGNIDTVCFSQHLSLTAPALILSADAAVFLDEKPTEVVLTTKPTAKAREPQESDSARNLFLLLLLLLASLPSEAP